MTANVKTTVVGCNVNRIASEQCDYILYAGDICNISAYFKMIVAMMVTELLLNNVIIFGMLETM